MTKRRPVLFILVAVLLQGAIGHAQNNASDTTKLIEALQLESGDIVAEIGAGRGELTIALAKHVGPTGKVYTSELGADRIQRLRTVAETSGLSNITVVEGQEKTANLPDECCDAVFMRNVYHHFGDPASMNASFLRALKPGGRIAVIDFMPPTATAPPGQRGEDGRHGVTADSLADELKAVGFEIVSADVPPAASPARGSRERWFIVVAAKPQK